MKRCNQFEGKNTIFNLKLITSNICQYSLIFSNISKISCN